MPEINGLSTAFAESHPAEAARVLETLPAADTAEFIAALTPALAAPILRHMGPPYAARVVTALEESHIVAVIQLMGAQAAARLVQQLTQPQQLQLLSRLPAGISIAIRLLVGYPRGTCGACMDPWPLALEPDMTAGDALEEIRKFSGDIGDCLFIANGQRRLAGVLALSDLLRAAPGEPLRAIMHPVVHRVSALASVTLAAGHPGWGAFHTLPVMERENRLVGALHRRALTEALAAPPARPEPNLASGVFAAYWQVVTALAEVAVGALPPVPPVAEQRRSDER